jgi:protein-disulfide isomerase-like protein with CxxC motif
MTKEDFYRIRNEVYEKAGMDKFDFDLMMVRVVMKAVEAERESCALLVEQMGIEGYGTLAIAASIRAREQV